MQFRLVGEYQIDRAVAHQVEKFAAIAIHAKGIRQGQRDLASRLMGDCRGLDEGVLGAFRIPEIAFKINHA